MCVVFRAVSEVGTDDTARGEKPACARSLSASMLPRDLPYVLYVEAWTVLCVLSKLASIPSLSLLTMYAAGFVSTY